MWIFARGAFSPQATIEPDELELGLKTLTREVVFSTFADSLVLGVMLTAFALHLGATSSGVGLIAAVMAWSQLTQGAGVLLIERLRRRKLIAVSGSLVMALAVLLLIPLAFAPPVLSSRLMLVAVMLLYGSAGAIAGCAWTAWIRDVVPDERRGRFFGPRSTLGTATSMIGGLTAAWLLDRAPTGTTERSLVFAALFALAFVSEVLSAMALSRPPEPQMPSADPERRRLLSKIKHALSDERFRKWVAFLASWQFAVNLATPFFALFFLRQLGFELTFVMVLTLVSQGANMLTLSRWGWLADRYTSKSVINAAAPIFLLCILAMIGASQFDSRVVAGAYLVVVHLVMGVAGAGVSLASGNLVMQLSPRGTAETYLATNALITSTVAGLAPLLGGFLEDFFAAREVALILQWTGPNYRGDAIHLAVQAWDFYFLLSFLLGLYALHRLALVREEGELSRPQMFREIYQQSLLRRFIADGGVRGLVEVPVGLVHRVRQGRGPTPDPKEPES